MLTRKLNKCPLCKSVDFSYFDVIYKNRYSEVISEEFNIEENKVLKLFNNYQCKRCKLIFKKNWLIKNFLMKLYGHIIPIHPKGWDKYSNDFNSKNFLILCKKFIIEKNTAKINILKRKITSILEAIPSKLLNNKFIKKFKQDFFVKKNSNIADLPIISKKILIPEDFSRFKGFTSHNLFRLIEKKINSKIFTLAEIGCPLWGFLEFKNIKNKYFIKANNAEFWGVNCVKNRKNCVEKLNNVKIVENLDYFKLNKIKLDYLGAFLYLDHITNLNSFFKKVFEVSKSLGIILEDPNHEARKGIAIQHFTAWPNSTIQYVAKKFNKKIYQNYEPISKLGNSFYLLYD